MACPVLILTLEQVDVEPQEYCFSCSGKVHMLLRIRLSAMDRVNPYRVRNCQTMCRRVSHGHSAYPRVLHRSRRSPLAPPPKKLTAQQLFCLSPVPSSTLQRFYLLKHSLDARSSTLQKLLRPQQLINLPTPSNCQYTAARTLLYSIHVWIPTQLDAAH